MLVTAAPHATVIGAADANNAGGAGLTVIILVCVVISDKENCTPRTR